MTDRVAREALLLRRAGFAVMSIARRLFGLLLRLLVLLLLARLPLLVLLLLVWLLLAVLR